MGRTSGGTGGGGGGPPYQSGDGEPTTATPASIGQLYIDTTNGALYLGQGTTEGNWVLVGGFAPSFAWPGVLSSSAANTAAAALNLSATTGVYLTATYLEYQADSADALYVGADNMQLGVPTDMSAVATIESQSVSSGSGFVPNANADVFLRFQVTHAGTLKMTMGPSTGTENTIWNTVTVVADQTFDEIIPAGWTVIITLASSATIGSVTKQVI